MADREKLIKDIEKQMSEPTNEYVVLWFSEAEYVLDLLKEHEAVTPILRREGRNKYYNDYVCPCCDQELCYGQNFCSECGKAVKWG